MHSDEDAEIITRATKTLGKMAKDASVIAELKSLDGIDVYLKVLDSFPDNDKIARLGGKVRIPILSILKPMSKPLSPPTHPPTPHPTPTHPRTVPHEHHWRQH